MRYRRGVSLGILLLLWLSATAFLKGRGHAPENTFLIANAETNPFYAKALERKGDEAFFEAVAIHYLIEAVRTSSLTFIRNGEVHSAEEAASHLQMKYLHAAGRVKKASDFIDYVASASILTGQPYLVRFPDGKTYAVRDLLHNELRRLKESLGMTVSES